ADIDAEAAGAAGAALAGFHHPGAGAGDDHEAGVGDAACELLAGFEHRIAGFGARRAQRAPLAYMPVGREHLEGVTHLLQSAGSDLEVADGGLIRKQLLRRGDETVDIPLFGVGRRFPNWRPRRLRSRGDRFTAHDDIIDYAATLCTGIVR